MEHLPDADAPNMVRCDVTDELVPEDETVVLQGKRVSARGKQILLDQLRTGHSIGGEIETPGWLRRLGCALLDYIIVMIPSSVVGQVYQSWVMMNPDAFSVRVAGALDLTVSLIATSYFVFMHAAKGQTVGKMAGKMKVINLDGSDIRFGTALVRGLFYFGISGFMPLLLVIGGETFMDPETGLGVYLVFAGIAVLYWIANIITVLATPQRRGIHDYVAGTRVILLDP